MDVAAFRSLAARLADKRPGIAMAAMIAMIAMTIISSISVNPRFGDRSTAHFRMRGSFLLSQLNLQTLQSRWRATGPHGENGGTGPAIGRGMGIRGRICM